MRLDEEAFVSLCKALRSTVAVAQATGISERNIISRRNRHYEKTKEWLDLDGRQKGLKIAIPESQVRTELTIDDGVVIVGSDAHYFPDIESAAHKAVVYLTKELKPDVFVMNGDSFDGATVSRFPRIGWDKAPTVKDEMETVSDRLEEIANASLNSKLLHTWGNHDFRFNNFLSNNAEQFEGVRNFSFEEHFPRWKFSMSIMVNGNTMIKHRYHGGIHAIYNNVLKSGRSIVTGHQHSLKMYPYTDYNGTRYGVDTGTLAYPNGDQFKYAEDNPKNQRSGFTVLTFVDGQLMPPDMCEVIDEDKGSCWFRGQLFNV